MEIAPHRASVAVALLLVFAIPHGATTQSLKPVAAVAPPVTPGTPGQPAAGAVVAPPALEPQGYTYDPAGRRDPFVSLLRRGGDAQKPLNAIRPSGLPGLETGEVTLKGTMLSPGGFVGMLQGSDGKTYIVRPGDRLLDGTIRSIAQDSLLITQHIDDPLSLEKEREVRKVLRQTQEAK
jgi:Tfp pilus assembly protein PilP